MRKILFVDDNVDLCELVCMELSALAYKIESAHSGQEALDRLYEDTFDLVITDLSMPLMNGIELTQHIKESFPDQKIVILTGKAEITSALQAIEVGADNYLLKPMGTEQLHAMIRNTGNKVDPPKDHAILENALVGFANGFYDSQGDT